MRDTPLAHLFVEPLEGQSELASEILARKLARWEAADKARTEQARNSRLRLLCIGFATTIISLAVLGVAANSGLSRAERAYQSAKV